MFEAHEIRAMLKAADPQLRAMIYCGVNLAFGPTDCGRLKIGEIKNALLTNNLHLVLDDSSIL